MGSEQTNLSTEQFLGILRRRAPWILLCVLIVAGAAYGFSRRETKKYTATASLSFNNNQLDQQIAGLSGGGGGLSAVAQQSNDIELVRAGNTSATTASLVGHGLTAGLVSSSLSIGGKGESNLVGVSATSTSPTIAAAIANTYVSQFAKQQQRANRQLFKSALALVTKQLAALTPAQRVGSDGLDLQNRAHTLSLLSELGYNQVEVAGEATVPSSPTTPKTKSNTILGLVVGLLLGLVVAFLLERFDRRVRSSDELEAIYRLPMLGVIPNSPALLRSARRRAGSRTALPPAEAEVFNLIRAHLRFFNVDRDLRTVLVASPSSGDGKTTVALHLAEAAARLGSRVLLLETDLRQPTLAQQLGVQFPSGLADVLIGDAVMDQATQSVTLQASPGEGTSGRTLDVLAAGGAVLPPNPGALLESQAMAAVLEHARSAYDLVVIDTPPLTAVSDAFPLLTKVDGVVIVGRIGHSRSDAAEQLRVILTSSTASLLGVIANGAESRRPVPYTAPASSRSTAGAAVDKGASSSEEFAPTIET
jgi:capsular exopolysaccharide synthesis family protein